MHVQSASSVLPQFLPASPPAKGLDILGAVAAMQPLSSIVTCCGCCWTLPRQSAEPHLKSFGICLQSSRQTMYTHHLRCCTSLPKHKGYPAQALHPKIAPVPTMETFGRLQTNKDAKQSEGGIRAQSSTLNPKALNLSLSDNKLKTFEQSHFTRCCARRARPTHHNLRSAEDPTAAGPGFVRTCT